MSLLRFNKYLQHSPFCLSLAPMKIIRTMLTWIKRLRDEGVLDLIIILWIIMFIGAITVFLLDYTSEGRSITTIFEAFYWAWVTMTTVGFGDLTPTTPAARIAASIMMFFSMALISFFTATISSIFVARKIREGKGLEKINYTDHYIICGWNDLADELLESLLKQDNKDQTPIVLVNELSEEEIDAWRGKLNASHLGFVRGDFTQDQILAKASVSKAKAVLILPNLIKSGKAEADEKTALATYSIKTLAPKARVYAYILHYENRAKLRRAKADGIIIADEFGPFMGASQLHNPGIPAFLSEMLNTDQARLLTKPVPEHLIGKPYHKLFAEAYEEYDTAILGVYQEETSAGIGDFLSADSGDYLDQFIAAKLKAAGRGQNEEQKIKVRINPEKDYIIKSGEQMILLK
ncbi:MAG: NAD-binding protein [Candidatus Marinimicrobia bacterium]|nr:NAD-binding protein [Candidatus Neomarinimicrobiota bacterium]